MKSIWQRLLAFGRSEMGRRVGAGLLAAAGGAIQGGKVPLDFAVPLTGLSLGEILPLIGVAVAATAGSSTRK